MRSEGLCLKPWAHSSRSHSCSSASCKRHGPQCPLCSGPSYLPPPFIGHLSHGAAHHCLDILGISSTPCLSSGLTPSFLSSARWRPLRLCLLGHLSLHLCSHTTLFSTWLSCVISWVIYVAPITLKDDDLSILYLQKLAWCLTHNHVYSHLSSYLHRIEVSPWMSMQPHTQNLI